MKHTFENHFVGTRTGFKHTSTLYVDGREVATATCYYYNRTWESYEFQRVMKCATTNAMEQIENEEIISCKAEHGYKRMSYQRKEAFKKYLNTLPEYAEYKKIYSAL